MNTISIDSRRLSAFAGAVLTATGLSLDDSSLVADSLVKADLWGHQSHGVMRLSWYVARLRTGAMNKETNPEPIVDAGAVAVLDGKDGVGQVIAHQAALEAIRRAKKHGIGAVGVRNSNHFGTAAYYARLAPPEGCIGLVTTT